MAFTLTAVVSSRSRSWNELVPKFTQSDGSSLHLFCCRENVLGQGEAENCGGAESMLESFYFRCTIVKTIGKFVSVSHHHLTYVKSKLNITLKSSQKSFSQAVMC